MKRSPILFTLGLAALGCGLDSGGDSVVFGSAGAGGGQSDASVGGAAATGGGINTGGVAGTGGGGGVSGGSGGIAGTGGLGTGGLGTGGLGTGGLGTGGLGTGGLGTGGLGTGGLGTGGVATGGTGGVVTGGTGGIVGTGGVATGGTGGVVGTGGVPTGGTGGVVGTGGVATGGTGGVVGTGGVPTGGTGGIVGTGGVATGGTGGIVGTGGVATGGTGGVATGGTGGVATGGSGGTGGVTGLDCSKWPGSQAFKVQGQTHCYWLVNSSKNFDDAQKDCSNNSGYLATIHSKGENDHVKSVAFGSTSLSAVWIGLSRDAIVLQCWAKSNFKWITGEPKPYENWDSGEPNCTGRRAAMVSGGGWRDRASWQGNSYVCEAGPAYQ